MEAVLEESLALEFAVDEVSVADILVDAAGGCRVPDIATQQRTHALQHVMVIQATPRIQFLGFKKTQMPLQSPFKSSWSSPDLAFLQMSQTKTKANGLTQAPIRRYRRMSSRSLFWPSGWVEEREPSSELSSLTLLIPDVAEARAAAVARRAVTVAEAAGAAGSASAVAKILETTGISA
jgi:hypothetical protein